MMGRTISAWPRLVPFVLSGALALASSVVVAAPPASAPAATSETAAPAQAEPGPGPDTTSAPREPEVSPAPQPSPPPAAPSLDQTALWSGLVGRRLHLELAGDATLAGKLVGQRAGQLVIERHGDGAILGVPYADVKTVRVDVRRDRGTGALRPPNNGAGLIAGGALLLGHGIPAVAAGAVLMWIVPGANLVMNMHLLAGGGAMIAGGSAMLSVGSERRKFWRLYLMQQRTASVGGFGGQAPRVPWSYTLRF